MGILWSYAYGVWTFIISPAGMSCWLIPYCFLAPNLLFYIVVYNAAGKTANYITLFLAGLVIEVSSKTPLRHK
jgi:hypothetical protein